jgi:radical SAM superfamily enzyme
MKNKDGTIGCVGHDCDECKADKSEIEQLRAEVTRLTEQLSSLAKGAKVSVPTDAMEQSFSTYHRRGYEKGKLEGWNEAIERAKVVAVEVMTDGLSDDSVIQAIHDLKREAQC